MSPAEFCNVRKCARRTPACHMLRQLLRQDLIIVKREAGFQAPHSRDSSVFAPPPPPPGGSEWGFQAQAD